MFLVIDLPLAIHARILTQTQKSVKQLQTQLEAWTGNDFCPIFTIVQLSGRCPLMKIVD